MLDGWIVNQGARMQEAEVSKSIPLLTPQEFELL